MFTHDTESGKKKLSHIAFIMDGNGRWANSRGLPREVGHTEGAKTFGRISEYCFRGGIDTVTVYAFSTENWGRPKHEVNAIMTLLAAYLKQGIRELTKNNVRVTFLGDKSPLSNELRELMEHLEHESEGNKYRLNVAINYGGRAEIINAVNRLMARGITELSEELLAGELYTRGQPDPDLIVRSAGELRLSNFLTWQSVYSELFFCDVNWAKFRRVDFLRALRDFQSRQRRFGK